MSWGVHWGVPTKHFNNLFSLVNFSSVWEDYFAMLFCTYFMTCSSTHLKVTSVMLSAMCVLVTVVTRARARAVEGGMAFILSQMQITFEQSQV